jgi:macrolide-specific efflux system membrane fusion protein
LKTANSDINVTRISKLILLIAIPIFLISGIGCAQKTTTPAAATQTATVHRGNLSVNVSVDGNLVMPQAYNLLFGAPGTVQNVYVQEGDVVKEGTVLATLDNTTQRLSVESANNNVQTVLSKLYETVPLLPQFPAFDYTLSHFYPRPNPSPPPLELPLPPQPPQPDYVEANTATSWPYYYPNATLLSAYNWAQDEVKAASAEYSSDNYTGAASELNLALADLEACTAIFQDTINNPESGLGDIASKVPEDEAGILNMKIQTDQSWAISYVVQLRDAIAQIQKGQAEISSARDLIDQGKYDEVGALLNTILKSVNDIGKVVYNNINIIKAHNYSTIYGEDISLYFYNAANDKLSAALKGIETGGLNSAELSDNLHIADHYMRLCNSILGSNDFVLQHGLSLKNQQQYNVDLQNALVGLGNAQDNFLKTVILAPFDGTVVKVGVKKNDVLSQIDYASVTAVQLVDTSQIKFEGQVDEIDILKIKTGQQATISVDAVPNQMFTGTVSFISPYGTPNTNGVVEFPVTIQLNPTSVPLKGGLTATADVSVSSLEDVLLVPVTAVNTTATGSFVTVINPVNGQQEKRQITLGAQNLQFAQVLSGLREGETVVIQETATKAPVVTGFPSRGGGGGPQGGR